MNPEGQTNYKISSTTNVWTGSAVLQVYCCIAPVANLPKHFSLHGSVDVIRKNRINVMVTKTSYWAPIRDMKILLDNLPRTLSLSFRRLCFCYMPPLSRSVSSKGAFLLLMFEEVCCWKNCKIRVTTFDYGECDLAGFFFSKKKNMFWCTPGFLLTHPKIRITLRLEYTRGFLCSWLL